MNSPRKINSHWAGIIALLILAELFLGHVNGYAQFKKDFGFSDSLFKNMSIDDLIRIKKHYESKVGNLRTEEESSRVEGLQWSENILSEKGELIKDRDNLYIRLAEYYIEEADRSYEKAVEETDLAYDEYERKLVQYERKEITEEPVPPEFPKYDYNGAIAVYDKLLTEYPASNYADDALYNKAWLLDKMDMGSESRKIFYEVIDKYPDSPFAPESYMRLADYFFAPREDKTDEEQAVVELNKAIQLYKNVLKYRETKRYDEALYKLGWSYYKLAAKDPAYYNDAITYFMAVVDDLSRAKQYDPRGTISNLNVRDEAIEYIGISFTDEAYTKAGVDKARRVLERLGGREYGPEIMQSIGQTYQRIDEQDKAIYAFRTLQEMYPDFKFAPQIQQNIVNAYYALAKDQDAYRAREELVQRYSPGTPWYQTTESLDDPDKLKYLNNAYRLSEAALRTNLLLDLEKAEEAYASNQTNKELYNKFAAQCTTYLKLFPADSNAYDVNWSYAYMLDSRLGHFQDAYEEYVRVSNDYIETSHQHDAALNAVAVADTIVEIKYGATRDTSKIKLGDVTQITQEDLTPDETRLVESYDNYIRLFPMGEYTPNFLAAAGGMYYNHKKFAEAKVYFQTLVKRFPNAEQKSLAMRSIMDSYFALGKFKDSEIVAKRILGEANISEEQRKFAEARLGQAIFKNAEYLEEQGDYFNAGSEYVRVYTEAPNSDVRMLEQALYNGGFNYQRAKDFVRAIETFNILVEKYPTSKFAINALENIAEDYKELEQFANSAQTFERIFNDYPKTTNAEPALYNASFFYKKAQDWNNAIRINNTYITTYPDQAYSVDLFFTNAELYLKLDNLTEANKIYEQFAQKYPDDPRTVDAFYQRGKYFQRIGQMEQAKSELNQAIQKSESFRAKGKDPNAFIAGEALNALAEILHQEFMAIELKQPKSNIEANQARMRNLMRDLNQSYSRVISFGSPRSFEATYNIARTYEEFADKFSKQEIDNNLSQDKRFVEINRVNEQSAALYEKAVEQFKEVVTNIPLIADRLGVSMDSVAQQQPMFSADSSDTSVVVSRAAEIDSTRQLARKWHENAKDKISELLYTQASLTSENVYQVFSVASPYKDKDVVQDMVYRLALYNKVATPAIQKTVTAHLRNMDEAAKLGLQNKYVEESKRQIIITSNLLGAELEVLAYAALDQYQKTTVENRGLIEQEFGAVNKKRQDYYVIDNMSNQLIDYTKIISTNLMNSYVNTLELARTNNIKNDLVLNTEDRLLRFSVEITDKMTLLADSAKLLSSYYRTRFDSTQNYNYDDAAGFFENYSFNFTDQSKGILERAFEIQDEYTIRNLWANRLLLKLIKMDPVKYSASVEKERLLIVSDDTWKATTSYYPEAWISAEYEDDVWPNAVMITSDFNQFLSLGLDPTPIWVHGPAVQVPDTSLTTDSTYADPDSLGASDSLMQAQTTTTASPSDTLVFFRKTFELKGTPLGGKFYTSADNDFRIYLNGEYLLDDEANDYTTLDSLDYYTFDTYLRQGKNVIGIDVEDKDLTGKGMKFYGYLEILPADITSAAEERAKVEKVIVDPALLKRIYILSKSRIPLSNR